MQMGATSSTEMEGCSHSFWDATPFFLFFPTQKKYIIFSFFGTHTRTHSVEAFCFFDAQRPKVEAIDLQAISSRLELLERWDASHWPFPGGSTRAAEGGSRKIPFSIFEVIC